MKTVRQKKVAQELVEELRHAMKNILAKGCYHSEIMLKNISAMIMTLSEAANTNLKEIAFLKLCSSDLTYIAQKNNEE